MRVLHMLPTYDAGGLGSLALELVRAWPRGDSHTAFAARWPGTRPVLRSKFSAELGSEQALELPRTNMNPMVFVDGTRDMLRDAGTFDGAVVYNWFDHVWFTMGLRRSGFKGPVLCHVGTVMPPSEMAQKMFGSPFTTDVRFVPASLAVREGLRAAGADMKRVTPTIWNGVNLRQFTVRQPRERDEVVFGFTGRMAPDAKDFDALLRGYAMLDGEAQQRARLVLAGDGPIRATYEQQARDLGLRVGGKGPRGVTFLGALDRDEVVTFLHALDVFVMAALPIEGMSMALVEALAAGLPIIATDVPSNREVLEGRAGILVDGAPGIAEGMERLVSNEPFRTSLANQSRACRDLFDVSRVAAAYRKLLASP